jgi:hypothetical protein
LLAASRPAPEANVNARFDDGGGRSVEDRTLWFGACEQVKRDLPAPDSYADAMPFAHDVAFFLAMTVINRTAAEDQRLIQFSSA